MGFIKKAVLLALFFGSPAAWSETVAVFCDTLVPQQHFAAMEVKSALESKGFAVEMRALASLSGAAAEKKVVLALSGNAAVASVLALQGGAVVSALDEQAFALRTTSQPQTSYWVLGGDENGAMIGGLQMAENIRFTGFAGSFNQLESPYIKQRGIKLNFPMDWRSATYPGHFNGTSYRKAIPNVWDLDFWKTWLDEMARKRYNLVSIWTNHPFTAMIKMADYPDAALQDVQGEGGAVIKTISIDEKIVFWKQVMAYAHARGFKFMLFTWNIYTENAEGQYGIADDFSNSATVAYMRKCMTQLWETYPDLDGFGMTAGEKMSGATAAQKEQWLWDTYGRGTLDFAASRPERKLTLIHRFHEAGAAEIQGLFQPLRALPNVTLDMSYKYAQAHMYSAPDPGWIDGGGTLGQLDQTGMKTWLTVRNDDMYFLHWGDPEFARAFIAGFPDKDKYIAGFYIGSDGFSPTRVFEARNPFYQGDLEVKRLWYREMIWGRIAYNPAMSDDIFKNQLAFKYPSVTAGDLFAAWSMASRVVPLTTEIVQGTWPVDFTWWPEGCLANGGFRTIDDFAGAKPCSGSKMCGIEKTAAGACGGAQTSYQTADSIEQNARDALSLANGMTGAGDIELGINLDNIRALSYLGLYYAEKIRGATDKMAGRTEDARTAMGRACCHWKNYADLMDKMYVGMNMHRVDNLPNWHSLDAVVLDEYTSLGGSGAPACEAVSIGIPVAKGPAMEVFGMNSSGLTLYLLKDLAYTLRIFTNAGEVVVDIHQARGNRGRNPIKFGKSLGTGDYWISLTSKSGNLVRHLQVSR